jgi:hypothetical protein
MFSITAALVGALSNLAVLGSPPNNCVTHAARKRPAAVCQDSQRSFQKDLRGFAILRFRLVEFYRLATAIHSPEQVHPTAGDANKSLVHVPRADFRFNST